MIFFRLVSLCKPLLCHFRENNDLIVHVLYKIHLCEKKGRREERSLVVEIQQTTTNNKKKKKKKNKTTKTTK